MDFSLTPNTAHASSDRDRYDEILDDFESISSSEMAVAVLDSFEDPLIVLNEKRQIIYTNAAFMGFLQLEQPQEVLGFRLGEALGCSQASKSLGGCGTSKACRKCGVVNAMLTALAGTPSHEMTRIKVDRDEDETPLEFMMETAPISFLGRKFARLSLKTL